MNGGTSTGALAKLKLDLNAMKISDAFKVRAINVTLPLLYIHHEAMDILFNSDLDSFNLDVLIDLLSKHESIYCSKYISENRIRLKLFSSRILDGLIETGLIQELPESNGIFVWNIKYDEENGKNPQ